MMNEWIISSSILIGLVLLGRLVLRGKISLRLQYALWGVVLLRLLMPVQLFSHDLSAGAIAQDVNISTPVRWVYTEVRSQDYQHAYDEAYRQIVAEYEARNQTAAPDVIDKEAYSRVRQDQELDLTRLLYGTWLAGMAVMAAVIVLCNVHFTRQLRRRRWEMPVSDCLLPVYVTEAVPTPCIFGFFRPAIYLTPGAARDDTVRRHVLHHELTHYRHGDHIWSVLRSVCLVLHWYNPLVWVAAKVSRADAELACDEGALKTLGEESRGDYARTLVGLTCADRIGSVLLSATTMTGSAGSIRERIRLLMLRPKNTVLTLTAVILLVTLIVGCTFAGAPETTEPVETSPSDVESDTPATGGAAIGEEPTVSVGSVAELEPLFTGDDRWYLRALTSYYDSPAQIDLFQLFYSGIPGSDNSVTAEEQAFLDTCPGYNPEWDLAKIPATEMDRILKQYFGISLAQTQGIGLEGFLHWEEGDCYYHSHTDINWDFVELIGAEYLEDGSIRVTYADVLGEICIVTLIQIDDGIQISSNLEVAISEPDVPPAVPDQTAEVAALFAGDDSWYLAALAAPYADTYSFDPTVFFPAGQSGATLTDAEKELVKGLYGEEGLEHVAFRMTMQLMNSILEKYIGTDTFFLDLSEFLFCPKTEAYILIREEVPQRQTPEILSLEMLAENQVRMIYRFPGGEQKYAATLLKGENWKVYSNQLILEKPLNARALTSEEAEQVRAAFAPYDCPLSCFVLGMYEDISEMSQSTFLSYYPTGEYGEATEEEFQLLKAKYPEDFENEESIQDMNWPITPIHGEEVRALMEKYTLTEWDELPQKGFLHYLEETDCYYTYYSDVGLFGFYCTSGWVYDGGATLFDRNSALILTEQNGKYYIQAHLPALIME